MKKNYFKSLLTALLLLCGSIASAEDFYVGGICYNITSATTVEVTYEGASYSTYDDDYVGHVVIPETVKYGGITYIVTSIGKYAFRGCAQLTGVTIGKNIKHIGDFAFEGCNIEEVHITDLSAWCSVSISETCYGNPMMECKSTYVANPLAGADLFINGNKATELVIPDGVTEIADYLFWGCNSLTSVIIPEGVTSIGEEAFYHCTNLTRVTMPNTITTIGNRAFTYCTGLRSITIPNSVTTIEYGAFKDCTSLTSVTMGTFVTTLESDVFDGTAWYNEQPNGLLYCDRVLLGYKGVISGDIVIKEGIETIVRGALSGCTGLISITIPNSVTTIGEDAFSKCTGLTSVTIPNSVTTIGESLFSGCSSLTSVAIPGSVTSIENYAFEDCIRLSSVEIPNNVTSIGKSAFSGCSRLASVTIPNSVTTIGESAFSGCSRLASVTIPNSVTTIGNYAFSNCTGLTSVTIGNSVTSIGNYAFSNCTGLTSVTIGNSVTSIGYDAFYGCTGITEIYAMNATPAIIDSYTFNRVPTNIPVYVPAGTKAAYQAANYWKKFTNIVEFELESGGLYYSVLSASDRTCEVTFKGSTYDEVAGEYTSDIVIPEKVTLAGVEYTVTGIAASAFRNCSGITSITIPKSIISMGSYAFSGCSSLAAVHISDLSAWCKIEFNNYYSNPLYYAKNLYLNGGKLTDLVIPDDITEIKRYAFCNFASLTNVTIPNSVTSIGYEAFNNCDGLTGVTIPSSVTSVESLVFDGCSNLKEIIIGSGVTSIGTQAFRSCGSLTSVTIPANVTNIGFCVFDDCTSLTNIKVESGNTVYDSRENCNAIIETATNTLVQGCKNTIIPDGVTTIGDYAFYGCKSLTSIEILNSVTRIGVSAFYNCTGLTSVTIGGNVTSIGNYAFRYCTGLADIYAMSATPAAIDSLTFDTDTYTAATLYVPAGSEAAYQVADYWKNFAKIDEIAIVGDMRFAVLSSEDATVSLVGYTGSSANVVIPENVEVNGAKYSVTAIGDSVFVDNTTLAGVTIPNSVTSIGNYAFYNCDSLASVTIPNSVTSIGGSAFSDCSGLTSVTIPNSVTSIGGFAFSGCTGLTSIEIPNGVTSIGNRAFSNCSGLASIKVESGNIVYDSRENCNAIIETATNELIQGCNNTIIPNSVTSIGSYAFSDCTGLTNVTIPNSVTSIGYYAFGGCTGLVSVTIGSSVTTIGRSAFWKCSSLVAIYSKAMVPPVLWVQTFNKYTATLYVPTGTKEAYQAARYWRNFANIVEMNFDIKGDITGDESVDVSDLTTLVGMILDSSLSTDAADLNGDGSVDVSDLTSLVSIILGTDTASEAPAKAAATRAAALSTISAEGDGGDLIINVTNPDFPFTAIQFDIYFPEGLEISGVEEDGVYYYDAFVGSRTNKRAPHNVEAAAQADGSVRVMLYSGKNTNFTGTEGDIVALSIIAAEGLADGEYDFRIKNAIISNPAGEQQKLAEHTGWITVTDGVTGIDAIIADDAANEEGAIYDLQGRKVTETVKGGIYIKDGKKFVVE